MRAFITLFIVGAACLASAKAEGEGSYGDDLSPGKPAYGVPDAPAACSPAPGGGYLYNLFAGSCPCDYDTWWDVTGGRCPADWAGINGYGYECHIWDARAEYLLWFSRGRNAPLLASTLSLNGGLDTYGNDPIGEDARSGLRLSLERLLADGQTWVGGRFWGLEDSTERAAINSGDVPIIFRPVFNVGQGPASNTLIVAPGFGTGGIDILSKNDLIGGDAWVKRTVWNEDYYRLDLLAGYQFTRLDDSIEIRSSTTALLFNPNVPVGTRIDVRDSFQTENEFHGGTLGFVSEWRHKVWSFELLGKLGLGSMREAVAISGQTINTSAGGASTSTARGLLAQPSNIGEYERYRFAVAPELNANGVVNLSPQWRLHIGYSILYWSHAALAGNQIDPRVNFTQSPGPAVGPLRPTFAFNRTDYVVQGLNLGAEYRW